MPPFMVNHQADFLADRTGRPTESTVYGFWVEDVGAAHPEILGGRVNRED